MKIYLDGNELDNRDSVLVKLDEIEKRGLIIEKLIIDGLEVYYDFRDYIDKNKEYIEIIEVFTISKKNLVDNILNSTLDYLESSLDQIKSLGEKFYAEPSDEDWNDLSDLLTGFMWIINTFISIDSSKNLSEIIKSYEGWNGYAQNIHELSDAIDSLSDGLDCGNNVEVGDILIYEISSIFGSMIESILSMYNEVN